MMCASDLKSLPALGFFTVVEHEVLGLTGGYLLLNFAGRPLEFHCTAPVKANRAQQILFGPTLDSYLYGEQIGQTLLAKGAHEPRLVCTDVALALSVRDYVALPVALVVVEDPGHAGNQPFGLVSFHLGRNALAVSAEHVVDRQTIEQQLDFLASFDLSEPFGRIREAIDEAHRVGRAA